MGYVILALIIIMLAGVKTSHCEELYSSRPLISYPKIICLDFDGVIHSYVSGWKGPRNIHDPPMPGAIDFLKALVSGIQFPVGNTYYHVAIYSSRSHFFLGRRAMKKWLLEWGIHKKQIDLIDFPSDKPPAFVSLDDRAITFNGTFPTVDELLSFKPYKIFQN